MMGTRQIVVAGAAVVMSGWLLHTLAMRMYFVPHAELTTDVAAATQRVEQYRGALADAARVEAELAALIQRTLGGDLETVDHRLRTRLNRIGETLALEDVVVGTGRAVPCESPARRKFSRRERELRDELDFVELNAWISARGTLEQTLALADAIEAEPWIKRVDQLRLDPRDNGAMVDVTVRLTTLFLPGGEPEPSSRATRIASRPDRYVVLAALNPFRVPPAEVPAPAPVAATVPPPPSDKRAGWSITGVAAGPEGDEVWLRHDASGRTHRLVAGEAFLELIFVGASGDRAEFRSSGSQFVILVGQNLNDRGDPDR